MPRTRSLAWSELKIGVLAVIAIAIAAALIFTLGGEGGFFWERYALKVRFPNAASVKPGSPVRVAGVEVGSVTAMRFEGAEVELTFEIEESMRERVRTTSVASIGSISLLGEGAVDITARTDGTPIPDGGFVPYGGGAGSLTDVTAQATRGIEELSGLIKDVRAGKGTAGRLVTDEALYVDLRDLAKAASGVVQRLNDGGGSIGRLLNNPTMARELETSLANLSEVTRRLSAGEGSLGQLLRDDRFARTLTETTENLSSLTARLNRGEGTAGKLLTDDALYQRLTGVVERFERVAAQVSDGQGSVGRLLNDRQLYENMNEAAGELRSLIADIRKDPRKYLNVKVSIF